MPTKHIDDATWRKVEKETVKAVIHLQASVKDTEVLRWLILKGLEEMTPEDLERFHKKGTKPGRRRGRIRSRERLKAWARGV
ncbi:hypothetical protein AAAC13_25940 [Pseudomonas aeruginosa]|uniref:hypothetical protein n=1 Tax=Pseudomonas aeruginosa TaxID=287 RepID=UPI001ADADFDD|nr:hypothetical protein [Pseudomonas aeruginosa]MBO8326119.1 hypothetical protein [Pseudomonas aeruginosa]WCY62713.1 hypothetical protein KK242_15405 [Pseudomonas aeruginosa]